MQATVKIFASSSIRCLNCGGGEGGELVRYNLGRAVPLRKWTHFYTKLNQTFDPLLYQKSHFSAKLITILKTFFKNSSYF